ncbi:hypothetical protein JCM11641_004346 [Rhodosporidiobolus odoratus]
MARKDIGRKPSEMDMLLSPSRGLQGGDEDVVSLRSPEVQQRFRQHIDGKLRKWATAHFVKAISLEQRTRRDEEMGIILLDLRKLREGITSIRRVDQFACEVYEASVLLSLFASNTPQLASSLPPLVLNLHSATRSATAEARPEPLATALSSLSISSSSPATRTDSATIAFYLTLHLLHSHLMPAYASPSNTSTLSGVAISAPPLSTFLPSLFSRLRAAHLPQPTFAPTHLGSYTHVDLSIRFLLALCSALVRNSYSSLARLLASIPIPPPAVNAHATALHLPPSFSPLAALLRSFVPTMRARAWATVERAYRFPPDQAGWLADGLLFSLEAEADQTQHVRAGSSTKLTESESWEDAERVGEQAWRVEAERRAVEWVQGKKGSAVR